MIILYKETSRRAFMVAGNIDFFMSQLTFFNFFIKR